MQRAILPPVVLIAMPPHILGMTTLSPKVDFQPIEMKAGSGWFVRVALPRGETPCLGGFKTEAEAAEWIKRKSSVWLRERYGYKYF
jgi:hypothetical protein